MNTCPYCGSKVESFGKKFSCLFCELIVDEKDVQQNGKRKNFLPASQPAYEDLQRSTPELMRMNIVELLFLLRFARAERSSIYGQRQLFILAIKEGVGEFRKGEQYTFKEYEYWTRKCFVIENLIRERLGYIPKKLTEAYIQNLADRMFDSAKKDMRIKEPKSLK
jgi:hypothetical protein